MYAVIKTGGKQYKVAKNDVILVEKLPGDAGATIDLDEVLMVGDDKSQTVGAPMIAGAHVAATVLEQTRGDKIIVFKKKRRQNYRRKNGHRQDLTALRITDITTGGKIKVAKAAEPKTEAKKTAPKAEQKKPTTKQVEAATISDEPVAIDIASDIPATEVAPKQTGPKQAAAKTVEAAPAGDEPMSIDVAPDMPATETAPEEAAPKKAKPAAKKTPAKKADAKPAVAKKAPARKAAPKKPAARKD